ncbi:MAG: chorismate-binding protein, partial [Nanoarchaeota archaeon]|nr:chorismate-binding protein [Nanoarchaeota archaeon]
DKIIGTLAYQKSNADEKQKLKLKSHLDILRAIAFKFNPTANFFAPYCGLFGMVSRDFINPIDNIGENNDALNGPDYIFYFLDNMFVVNHKEKKTYFVSNAIITDNNREKAWHECGKTINNYEKVIAQKLPKGKKYGKKELKVDYDSGKGELPAVMKDLRRHILDGDMLLASPSRKIITGYNAEPLDIYARLKGISGNNFCYIHDRDGISICYGSKAILNVKGNSDRSIELKISTAAKPRAVFKEGIEKDLDNKYEALLKIDENEIDYHILVVDSMRNDIAKVSKPGTRYVDKLFVVEKGPNSQNIMSSVKGTLREGIDVLHAFSATLNPCAINGYPKIKSASILENLEKEKNGMASASVLFITPDKCLQGAAMNPIRIKKDKAYIGISSRVFNNSSDENEINANNNELANIIGAINAAGNKK